MTTGVRIRPGGGEGFLFSLLVDKVELRDNEKRQQLRPSMAKNN